MSINMKFRILLVAVTAGCMAGAMSAQTGTAKLSAPVSGAASRTAYRAPYLLAAVDEEAASAPSNGGRQNIKVHGHWLIDVRNPDGTLAQHRDFENSLQDSGFNITQLMAGTITAGEPTITLYQAFSNPSICFGAVCRIAEYANGAQAAYISPCAPSSCAPNLVATVVTIVSGSTTSYALKLSGQFTAAQNGGIGSVGTVWFNCATSSSAISNVPPSSCASQTNLPANSVIATNGTAVPNFTATSISTLSVTSGQIIQVTVTLTFS